MLVMIALLSGAALTSWPYRGTDFPAARTAAPSRNEMRGQFTPIYYLAQAGVGAGPSRNQGSREKTDLQGNTELIDAVNKGDIVKVRELLARGADVNHPGNGHWTALMRAVAGQHAEIVQLLLKHGADPNAKADDGGHTALMCITKGTKIGQMLISAGAEVNAARRDGLTPLMQAIASNNTPFVKLLLSRGANPHARMPVDQSDFSGWSASDWANFMHNPEIIEALAEHESAAGSVVAVQGAKRPESGPRAKDGKAASMTSSSTPELDLRALILKPRQYTDAVLGRAKLDKIDDCDPSDRGYVYPGGSYVCTHRGNVVLVSYQVKAAADSPAKALAAIGLETSSEGTLILPGAYAWVLKQGNPISLSGTLIPSVNVILGKEHTTIIVDMYGADLHRPFTR